MAVKSTRSKSWGLFARIFVLLLAWLFLWPACMSFQRDGWDPKWGEEGAEDSDEPAPAVETRRRKNTNQPEAVARDDAWDEVDEDLPLEDETETEIETEPAPVTRPAPEPSLDVETVAIPAPDKDDTIETVPLQPDPPAAEPKNKKKNDAEEKEEKEKKGAAK